MHLSCFSEEGDLSRGGGRKKIPEGCVVDVNEELGSIPSGTAPGSRLLLLQTEE